jgi:hypothetical protein
MRFCAINEWLLGVKTGLHGSTSRLLLTLVPKADSSGDKTLTY